MTVYIRFQRFSRLLLLRIASYFIKNNKLEMGNASAKAVEIKAPEVPAPANAEKPKLKPCCACPETKKARDACIIEHGEENCGPLIEEHKACMRKMGFNI